MLALTLSGVVNLVHAHFLVPTRDGQDLLGGREDEVGDGVLRGLVESDVLGKVALGVRRGRRRGSRAEQRHLVELLLKIPLRRYLGAKLFVRNPVDCCTSDVAGVMYRSNAPGIEAVSVVGNPRRALRSNFWSIESFQRD